jgi:hypothetical protein
MMRHDSPPPSWYEPADVDDGQADESEFEHAGELLTIATGVVTWTAAVDDDD